MSNILINNFSVSLSPDLTICIPVFKRPELFEMAINAIVNAKKLCPNLLVQFVISDDSGDGRNEQHTKMLCNLQNTYLNYIKTIGSVGFENNFFNAFSWAEGRYTTFIGEDDFISIDYFCEVEKLLSGNEKLFLVDYVYMNNECSFYNPRSVFYGIESLTGIQLLKDHIYKLGFMGSLIIDTVLLREKLLKITRGTWFPHVSVMVYWLSQNMFETLKVSKPIIFNRAEDSDSFTWSDKAFENLVGFRTAVFEPFGISPSSTKIYGVGLINFGFLEILSVRKVLAMRAKLSYSALENFRIFWKCSNFVSFTDYFLPVFFNPILRAVAKLISARRRQMFNEKLDNLVILNNK